MKDFNLETVSVLVKDSMNYHLNNARLWAMIWACLFALTFAIMVISTIYILIKRKKERCFADDCFIGILIIGFIVCFFSAIGLIVCVSDINLITLSPNLWIDKRAAYIINDLFENL